MEEEVRAVEQRWLKNEERPEVVQSILADDFVHVLSIGFINKADHIGYLRQHPNTFPGTKHFEELRVRIYGDVAMPPELSARFAIRIANRRELRLPTFSSAARESGWP